MKVGSHLLKTALFAASLSSSLSYAGGLFLYDIGTDNNGLSNAGAAARAQGPSTIASNPAGLTYLAGDQATAAAQLLFGDITYDSDSSTNVDGKNSGNVLGLTPGAAFFVSHQIDDKWSAGFGSYGDFGLSVDFGNDWKGRYFVQDATLLGLSMVPTLSYKANDQWSFGVGAKAMYGILQTQMAIDETPLNRLDRQDGQLKYEDTTWGYGANVGVIYQPKPETRIGLTYTSQIDLNFEDNITVNSSAPIIALADGAKTKLDLVVPQTVTLSLYQKLDDRWAFLASTNWQDWSEFGEVYADVDFDGIISKQANINAGFKDTWHLSVGTQYQATEKALWNLGLSYDSSMVSDSNRPIMLPTQQTWDLGTGITYAFNKDVDLNVSWSIAWLGDVEASQTKSLSGATTSGSFDDAWIQTIGGSATWRF
jgi:long-chain fatty acid transport protein